MVNTFKAIEKNSFEDIVKNKGQKDKVMYESEKKQDEIEEMQDDEIKEWFEGKNDKVERELKEFDVHNNNKRMF